MGEIIGKPRQNQVIRDLCHLCGVMDPESRDSTTWTGVPLGTILIV